MSSVAVVLWWVVSLLFGVLAWASRVGTHNTRATLDTQEGSSETTPRGPQFNYSEENSAAKHVLMGILEPGSNVSYYELCPKKHPLNATYRLGRTAMYILGALWAVELPHLELLIYLRKGKQHMDRTFTICFSFAPKWSPSCHFPSGKVTEAKAIWPAYTTLYQKRRYYIKRAGVTTSQFHCPVPPGEFSGSEPTLAITLRDGDGHSLSLTMRRVTQRVVEITGCPHPLYNYLRIDMLFPDVIHEWLAYHKRIGFGHFHIYDETGDFEEHMRPWVHSDDYMRYYPRFPDPLNFANRMACCCNEAMTFDHCLFVNQLTSKWVMILHSFDMFLHVDPTYAPTLSGALQRRLQDAHATLDRVSEIIVNTRLCGSTVLKDNVSSIMQHTQCLPQVWFMLTTPIFNPRNVRSTIVHRALLYTKNARSLQARRRTLQTLHYSGTRPTRWKMDLKKNHGYVVNVTEVWKMWPQVHQDVVRIAGLRETRNVPRVLNVSDLPPDFHDSLPRRKRRRTFQNFSKPFFA
jgi:hypothetical protein